MLHTARRFGFMCLTLMCAAMPLQARAQSASVAPYDERLIRLAEILGSVHYLRNLCGETSNKWRDQMDTLLSVEKPEPGRRALLIASFNRGYRSYGSVYEQCTQQAVDAVARFQDEGIKLTNEINSLFGE